MLSKTFTKDCGSQSKRVWLLLAGKLKMIDWARDLKFTMWASWKTRFKRDMMIQVHQKTSCLLSLKLTQSLQKKCENDKKTSTTQSNKALDHRSWSLKTVKLWVMKILINEFKSSKNCCHVCCWIWSHYSNVLQVLVFCQSKWRCVKCRKQAWVPAWYW